jgi:hypothetical protein
LCLYCKLHFRPLLSSCIFSYVNYVFVVFITLGWFAFFYFVFNVWYLGKLCIFVVFICVFLQYLVNFDLLIVLCWCKCVTNYFYSVCVCGIVLRSVDVSFCTKVLFHFYS